MKEWLSNASLEAINNDYHGDRHITILCHALQDERTDSWKEIDKLKCDLEMGKCDAMVEE